MNFFCRITLLNNNMRTNLTIKFPLEAMKPPDGSSNNYHNFCLKKSDFTKRICKPVKIGGGRPQ